MRHAVFSTSTCCLLDISSIGYAADASVTRFGPGVRNSYILHYVIAGKGYFNGNAVSAGQGFVITPGMQEHYYPDPHDPWEFLWVISNDDTMAALFEQLHPHPQTHIFQYHYVYAVKELSTFLISKNNARYNAFEMLEIFLKILIHSDTSNQRITIWRAMASAASLPFSASTSAKPKGIAHPADVPVISLPSRTLAAFSTIFALPIPLSQPG
jgi:hypothetical protein